MVSSTNKTDRHDITEIVLKVALNTITNSISIKLSELFEYIYMLQKDTTLLQDHLMDNCGKFGG
jgi:hypothetical protein